MLSMTSSYLTRTVVVLEDAAVEAAVLGGSWIHTPGGRATSRSSSGCATCGDSRAGWFGLSSAISSSVSPDVEEELGTWTVSGFGRSAPPKVGVRGAASGSGVDRSETAGCSSLISDWEVIQLESGRRGRRGGLALP